MLNVFFFVAALVPSVVPMPSAESCGTSTGHVCVDDGHDAASQLQTHKKLQKRSVGAPPVRCGQMQFPQAGQQEAASGVQLTNLPSNALVDVNIGTNLSPFPAYSSHYTILVDPIQSVCQTLIARFASDPGVCFLCLAVSNYSGTAAFRMYNHPKWSSLTPVSKGTGRHEKFEQNVVLQPVFVVQALPLLREALAKNVAIERLKLDMQGHDFSVLRDIRPILAEAGPAKIRHIMVECFFPNGAGKQIYEIDNSCQSVLQYLRSFGYTAKLTAHGTSEWSDLLAYKSPATSFLPESAWS